MKKASPNPVQLAYGFRVSDSGFSGCRAQGLTAALGWFRVSRLRLQGVGFKV